MKTPNAPCIPLRRRLTGAVLFCAALIAVEVWTAAQVHSLSHIPGLRVVSASSPSALSCCGAGPRTEAPGISAAMPAELPHSCVLCAAALTAGVAIDPPTDALAALLPTPSLETLPPSPDSHSGVLLPPSHGPPHAG